jgi:hypothetical protein
MNSISSKSYSSDFKEKYKLCTQYEQLLEKCRAFVCSWNLVEYLNNVQCNLIVHCTMNIVMYVSSPTFFSPANGMNV